MKQNKPIITLNKISKYFGGLKAIEDVSFSIQSGKITALIGPNGAGKTTLFNCMTGLYKPTSGSIDWTPEDYPHCQLNTLTPHQATRAGLARTFQNIRLFANMTTLENVMIGRHVRTNSGILGAIFRFSSTKMEERKILEKSMRLLKLVGLEYRAATRAKNLPYGEQRRLEIARALATEPELLLLDEPAAGLNPRETKSLDDLIKKIQQKLKITVFLIEHDMKLVMNISDQVVVMDHGKLIADNSPQEVARDPKVIAAYLGGEV
jgi:branched-chain amino acid transport system ATP-binding protein